MSWNHLFLNPELPNWRVSLHFNVWPCADISQRSPPQGPATWWLASSTLTVDGRNPKQPPGMVLNPLNNGINYQPQLVGRISEPSTVANPFFFQNPCYCYPVKEPQNPQNQRVAWVMFKLFSGTFSLFWNPLSFFFWEGECFTTFKFCFFGGAVFVQNQLGYQKREFKNSPLWRHSKCLSFSQSPGILQHFILLMVLHILGTICLPQLDRGISFNSRCVYYKSVVQYTIHPKGVRWILSNTT